MLPELPKYEIPVYFLINLSYLHKLSAPVKRTFRIRKHIRHKSLMASRKYKGYIIQGLHY